MTDETLQRYRESIDNIDAALIHILAERFRITKAVGAYKAENALPPSDPGREERQIARLLATGETTQRVARRFRVSASTLQMRPA